MFVSITSKGKKITHIKVNKPVKTIKKVDEAPKLDLSVSEQRNITLKNARLEGIYSAAKNGMVANYIAPLGIHLGFSSFAIILLTALPQLIGAISQLFVERLAHFFRNRFKLLVLAGYLEAYTWLLIVLIAAFSINNPYLLIILIILDAIFVNIQSPIWNAILGDVIPSRMVVSYFGKRNLFVGASGFISTLLAGIILSKLTNIHAALGFSALFFIGFLCARLSVHYQSKVYDPAPKSMTSSNYTFYQFIKNAKKSNFGNFVTFSSAFKFAVAIASPFFAIYMLRELNLSYMIFTIIITGGVLSSMISTSYWTKLAFLKGSRHVLKISTIIICFIPLLWLITNNWKVLLFFEIFSGFVWAGFNIASSAFVFEAVNPKQKIKFMAYNNVLGGVGAFIGTMAGILIQSSNLKLFGSIFLTIFLISAIFRFIAAAAFIEKIKEEKVVAIGVKDDTYKSFITIRPREGVVFEIIGKTERVKEKKHLKQDVKNKKIRNEPSKSPFKEKPKY